MNKKLYIASSPWFVALATILYGGLVCALWLANWPLWLRAGGVGLALLDWFWVIRVYGLRSHRHAVTVLERDCDKWQYQLVSGRRFKGSLVKQRSYVSSLLVILYMRHRYDGRYIVIPRDALSKHNYRGLAFSVNSTR